MRVLLSILLAFFLSGCASLYVPNVVHTPLLTDKGEGNVLGAVGMNGYDVGLNYAPADKVGLMINGSFGKSNDDSTVNEHYHRYLEFGGGYWSILGDDESGVFELYTGAGLGYAESISSLSSSNWSIDDYVEGNYLKLFVQPAIGSKTDFFHGSFAVRASYLYAYNLTSLDPLIPTETDQLYIEPSLMARFGGQRVKFRIQCGASLRGNLSEFYFKHRFLILNFGIYVPILGAAE